MNISSCIFIKVFSKPNYVHLQYSLDSVVLEEQKVLFLKKKLSEN